MRVGDVTNPDFPFSRFHGRGFTQATSEAERTDDGVDVRQVVKDEVSSGGLKGGAAVAASGDADALRVDREGARDIVRGIPDDEDVLRAE
jgi:hypothetical protein